MELKCCSYVRLCALYERFNRTFMELKFTIVSGGSITFEGFNRTFMELKSCTLTTLWRG